MKLALGLLGGPYAWALGLRGELDEAAAWIHHIARSLPGPHRFLFAYLAAAQYGARDDVLAMRAPLVEAAARPQDRVNVAVLALFDAFAAQRGIVTMDVRARALEAAAAFEVIGWPWLAARGYELGGEPKRAQETYRTLGAARDLRRIEVDDPTPRRPSSHVASAKWPNWSRQAIRTMRSRRRFTSACARPRNTCPRRSTNSTYDRACSSGACSRDREVPRLAPHSGTA